MSTVYLHMGMPKTGTTALQRFFLDNKEVLEKHGIGYPIMPFKFDHVPLARNGHFMSYSKEKDASPEWKEGFSVIKETAQKFDRILMTDERLWSAQRKKGFWKAIKTDFGALGIDIKVILYLRRQDEQVESHWNQKVKESNTRLQESFSEYIGNNMHYYMPLHYNESLDRVAARIGKENIILRVYEKQQLEGGSIFSDFLHIFGIGLDEDFKMPEYTANVRLPNNAVEIKRIANAMYPSGMPDFYFDVIAEAFGMKRMKNVPTKKMSHFSPEERKEFMKQYDEGNAYVAREYLNRKDGILFYGDYDIEQWHINEKEMLLDVIRVLCTADMQLYRRQDEIIKSLKDLYNTKPARLYRKLTGRSDK